MFHTGKRHLSSGSVSDGLNWYGYVDGNPGMERDPMGYVGLDIRNTIGVNCLGYALSGEDYMYIYPDSSIDQGLSFHDALFGYGYECEEVNDYSECVGDAIHDTVLISLYRNNRVGTLNENLNPWYDPNFIWGYRNPNTDELTVDIHSIRATDNFNFKQVPRKFDDPGHVNENIDWRLFSGGEEPLLCCRKICFPDESKKPATGFGGCWDWNYDTCEWDYDWSCDEYHYKFFDPQNNFAGANSDCSCADNLCIGQTCSGSVTWPDGRTESVTCNGTIPCGATYHPENPDDTIGIPSGINYNPCDPCAFVCTSYYPGGSCAGGTCNCGNEIGFNGEEDPDGSWGWYYGENGWYYGHPSYVWYAIHIFQ